MKIPAKIRGCRARLTESFKGKALKPIHGIRLKNNRGQLKWWAILAIDILALGAALIVFALFHHALPQVGEELPPVAVIQPAATPEPTIAPAAVKLPAEAEPTPTPTPPPIGDFSASYPDKAPETELSYYDENISIGITEYHEDYLTYYFADIYVRDIEYFRTAFAKGEYGKSIIDEPLDIASESGAIIAITGDFYGLHTKGVVIRNGNVYRTDANADVCVVYRDGVMETYGEDEYDADAVLARDPVHAWNFGPALIGADGKPAVGATRSSVAKNNPRSVIGYFEPGHYCFVTVDGRQGRYSRGLDIEQLSALMVSLGCKTAYNLDGGKSAIMVFKGEVVNQPYEDGRRISDMVSIGYAPETGGEGAQ